jgi:drug/metabolite transporter (DMT)-like permease
MENHSIGFAAGLSAAFCWAIASVVFKRCAQQIHPIRLNSYKGLIAGIGIMAVLAVNGQELFSIEQKPFILLFFSGFLGIGIGDTAFFGALNRLGARKTVIIAETGAPLLTIILAGLILGEILNIFAMLSMLMVLVGLYFVLSSGNENAATGDIKLRSGLVLGAMAAVCQSVGGILTRAAFNLQAIDPMHSAMIRLLGAMTFLLPLIPFIKKTPIVVNLTPTKLFSLVLLASLIGTFGGISLQQIAFKHTYAAIAQVLIASSSLFILLLAWIKGHRSPRRVVFGACLALGGLTLLFITRSGL